MSSLSAGKIQVENLSVAGLGAGSIKATNLKFENLDVSGNLTVQGAQVATQSFVSSAVQGVIGSAGAALDTLGEIQAALGDDANLASTLTTSIATKANASDVTSGLATKAPVASPTFTGTATAPNLVVSGNITNAALTALNIQMQNTITEPESVYYYFGSDAVSSIWYPIMEISKDINRPIYTDSTNTTISQQFINETASALPPSGKILYYPNGVGTPQFPIDGTAGTPVNSAISANIGTPSFVDVTDASGVYGVALKSIHRKSPLVKDASGNLVGGNKANLNYTSYADLDGPFTEQTLTTATQESLDYYSVRGYANRAPNYIPTDLSGNIIEKNLFVCNYGSTGYHAFEFVYPSASSIVPSSMFLTFYNSSFMVYGSKYMADLIPGIRTPVSIPVTTNPVSFGQAVIDNVNSVLYDINKKQITINFVVENIWNNTKSSPNLNFTETLLHKMKTFKGSYAVVKKSQHTFINNGDTASIFVSCALTDPAAFMMQISPTVDTNNDLSINGAAVVASNLSRTLNDTVTGNFQGFVATRPGLGNQGSLINAIMYRPSVNSTASTEELILSGGLGWGDNPYTTYYEYLVQRGRVTEWSNNGWRKSQYYLDFDILSTTPESMALIPSSNYRASDTDIPNMNTTVMLHELYHHTSYSSGSARIGNNEGEATAIEQDASIYLGAPSWNLIRSITAFLGYMFALSRGYFVLTRNAGSVASVNDQYTRTRLGFGNPSTGIPHGGNAMYGEAMFYADVALKYDKTHQILRRKQELTSPIVNKVLYDNGVIEIISISFNAQIAKHLYAQALYDVTGLSLAQVYSDYAISSAFLRNNASIPDKYKTSLPVWIWGSTNTAATTIAATLGTPGGLNEKPLKDINFWTDFDRSLPLASDKYGFSITSSTSVSADYRASDAHTIIPFWPRDASGNAKWSMGTWARDSSGYVTSFTYSTTPYVASRTIVLEDMAMNSYILPVAGATGLGVSSVMSSISIEVKRGNWDFTVAQFVPDGSGGSWTQLPSIGNVTQVNNPGTWDDASGEVFASLQTSYLDAAESQTVTFDLSGFSVQTHDGFKYYPKLVCVNRGLDDYGVYKNITPVRSRYSGKIVITPTFV
jgi:hypothetical protein